MDNYGNGSGNEEPEQLRKMFLGGLSFDTNEESIQDYFKSYGEIVDCCVVIDKETKKPRGFGFVTFSKSDSVEKVMRAKKDAPHKLDGRDIDVKRALSKEDAGPKEPVTKAFVGGLAPETTEDDLRDHFSQFGNVIEVTIPKRSNEDKKRGFGFVTFEDSDSVDCIIIKGHHDPHIIHDRTLDVKKAVPKDRDGRFGNPRGGRGRMRGGRDFRGGYGSNRGGYRSGGGDYGGGYSGGRYQQSGYGNYGGGQGGSNYGSGSYGGSGYHSSGYDNSGGGGGGYNDFGSGYGNQNSSYGPMKGNNSGYRNNPYSGGGGGYGSNSGGGGSGSYGGGYGGSYNSGGSGRNSNYY